MMTKPKINEYVLKSRVLLLQLALPNSCERYTLSPIPEGTEGWSEVPKVTYEVAGLTLPAEDQTQGSCLLCSSQHVL